MFLKLQNFDTTLLIIMGYQLWETAENRENTALFYLIKFN